MLNFMAIVYLRLNIVASHTSLCVVVIRAVKEHSLDLDSMKTYRYHKIDKLLTNHKGDK